MPALGAKERAQLPDSAFAYIDSRGRRRLPIHDAAHVRNALARFGQVAFEDDGARDRARSRLLRAAKKHGIMPIGFISAQLQPQRRLPKGDVSLSVHTAARICFAAQGGQIVMSSAVHAAVPESLADGVSLRSLGAWRFRGLPEPVGLFQVDAVDLSADFPPLRSAVLAE